MDRQSTRKCHSPGGIEAGAGNLFLITSAQIPTAMLSRTKDAIKANLLRTLNRQSDPSTQNSWLLTSTGGSRIVSLTCLLVRFKVATRTKRTLANLTHAHRRLDHFCTCNACEAVSSSHACPNRNTLPWQTAVALVLMRKIMSESQNTDGFSVLLDTPIAKAGMGLNEHRQI